MVQVLKANNNKSNFAQQFAHAIGTGASEGISEGLNRKRQLSQLANENKAIKENFNIDLSNINDPDLRKAYFAQEMKNQGKLQQLNQKQEAFDKIFNRRQGQQDQEQSQQPQDKFGLASQNARAAGMPQEQQGMENQGGFDASQLSEQDILKIGNRDPNLGRLAQHAKDVALREKTANRDFEYKKGRDVQQDLNAKEKLRMDDETGISKPILIEMNELRKNIPLQEQAIQDIIEASPNVGALDFFVDLTGFEPLRSASGAKLKTGIKDFFLSDLSRAGARPNQWIEQQLADALPKIGRSKEANLITSEGLRFKVDLQKKRMEIIDELAEKDREKYGYVKADIDARAYKQMQKYTIDRQKVLKDNIKDIKKTTKKNPETIRVTGPDGSMWDVPSEDLPEDLEAEKAKGYKFG